MEIDWKFKTEEGNKLKISPKQPHVAETTKYLIPPTHPIYPIHPIYLIYPIPLIYPIHPIPNIPSKPIPI